MIIMNLLKKIQEAIEVLKNRADFKFEHLISMDATDIINCIEIGQKEGLLPETWLLGMRIYSKMVYILENEKEILRLPISEEDYKQVEILAEYFNLPETWKSGCTPDSVWLNKLKAKAVIVKRPSVRV